MSETPTGTNLEPESPRRLGRWAMWSYLMLGAFVALIAAAQIAAASEAWQPDMGDSVKNFVRYGSLLLLCVGGALWALVLGPFGWKKKLLVAGLFVLPVVGFLAVMRDVAFDGDMNPTITFRWDEPDTATKRAAMTAPETSTLASVVEVQPDDYAEYRGVARDGRVASGGGDMTQPPAKEVWRRDVGAGWAGMAVVGDVVVTLEQIGGEEAVVAYDANTGDELWRNSYQAAFDEAMGGLGPRSTPTIVGDRVYTMGAEGHLTATDFATGDTVWQVDTLAKYGVDNVQWANAGSPLVREGVVYINVGSLEDGGLTAFDADTGEAIWRASKSEWDQPGQSAAGYASPAFEIVAGVEQIVLFDGKAVRGYDAQTGQTLWSYPFANDPLVNVAQPVVLEDGPDRSRVFIAASYTVGSAMLNVSRDGDQWTVEKLWGDHKLMKCKFTSPVLHRGFLYGLSEGILECVDATTGERQWKRGRYGHGQILLVDDTHILVAAEDGRAVLVEASPEKHTPVWEQQVVEGPRNWNPPSLSRGRLFVRNDAEMTRWDFPRKETEPLENEE